MEDKVRIKNLKSLLAFFEKFGREEKYDVLSQLDQEVKHKGFFSISGFIAGGAELRPK